MEVYISIEFPKKKSAIKLNRKKLEGTLKNTVSVC